MGSNLSSAVLGRDLDIITVLFNLEPLLDSLNNRDNLSV